MNDQMKTQLENLIKANLPQQLGDALRQELFDLNTLRVSSREKDQKITDANELISDLKQNLNELTKLESDVRSLKNILDKKEIDIIARENKQNLLELELKLEKERRVEIKDLALAFVKSPVITRYSTNQTNAVMDGGSQPNGGKNPSYIVPVTDSLIETTTIS